MYALNDNLMFNFVQENIHPFGFSYNPRFSKWSTMAPMLTERCRFTLNVVQNKLYAIGGASESVDDNVGTTEGCSCEAYDSSTGMFDSLPVSSLGSVINRDYMTFCATDSWSQIAPLSTGRTQHAGAAWNHLLFISGIWSRFFSKFELLLNKECCISQEDLSMMSSAMHFFVTTH